MSLITDPNSANNSASAETTVTAAADLSLTKTDSPDPVLAGELLTYTLERPQRRAAGRDRRHLTDTLPGGVTFDSATPSQGTCSEASGTVTCALGTIAERRERERRDQGHASGRGHDHEPGRRHVRPADPDTADNTASADTTVEPAADLSLTKTDSPDPVLAGELLTYTLAVHNAGPQSATGVDADRHAAGRGDVRLRHAHPGHLLRGERHRHLRRWARSPTRATPSVEIKVRRSTPGTITNQADVVIRRARPDHRQQLRQRRDDRRPGRRPVADEDRLARPGAGRRAAHLHAHGPQRRSPGRDRRRPHRHAPGGVTFDSATPSQGSCSQAAGTVTCALGTIADQATATVQVAGAPLRGGHDLQPGQRVLGARRPELRQQLRHRPDHRHRGAGRATRAPRGLPRCGPRWCRPTPSARLPTAPTARRLTPPRATHPRSARAS